MYRKSQPGPPRWEVTGSTTIMTRCAGIFYSVLDIMLVKCLGTNRVEKNTVCMCGKSEMGIWEYIYRQTELCSCFPKQPL